MDDGQKKDRPALVELLRKAAQHKMTPAEIQAQRISFAYGNQPHDGGLSKNQVAEIDYARNGNLSEMEAEIARLRAENDMLRKVNAEQAARLQDREYET